jgi:hypothetical protein
MVYRILRAFVGFVAVLLLRAAPAEPATFEVRSVPDLTEDARIELGRLGEPSWHTAGPKGETLDKILRAICGSQGVRADDYLAKATLELNGAESLDQLVDPGVAVAVPFCLEVQRVKIERGDTVEQLLRERHGEFGPHAVRQTCGLNRQEGPMDCLEFTRHLQPDEEIYLPTSRERVFVTRRQGFVPTNDAQIPITLAQFEGISNAMTALQLEAAAPPANAYRYIEFVSLDEASSAPDCGPQTVPLTFSVQKLAERLAVENQAAALASTERTAIVGVIDSGLGGIGGPFFDVRFFAANRSDIAGNHTDDEPNGYYDDVYGMNLNGGNQNGSIAPYGADRQRSHGTKIASLILGGPEWVHNLAPTIASRIQLKIVNFSNASDGYPLAYYALNPAIGYLVEQNADVINMSLASELTVESAVNAMEKANRTLFVTAAGNEPKGRDLASYGAYPAGQGGRVGRFRDQLITVGAHDNDGNWAPFSNFSREYVDLLAPGCALPTVDLDGNEVKENGTSVATAIVSFAAGLVSSLGERLPHAIKNRLLASVDVDPRLERKAWTSGRLNVVKAVSLRHDLIELAAQPGNYQFGRLVDRDELRKFCADKLKRPFLERLVKVRPNVVRDGETFVEYWGVRNDSSLWRDDCIQEDGHLSIGMFRVGGVEIPGPALREVRDIVFATYSLPAGAP